MVSAGSTQDRIPLRDAADIKRLRLHLLTHWTPPAIDVRIDTLPTQDSHRAQDHFTRLAEACNCVLGETLGGVTLLVGTCLACLWQGWYYFGITLIAATAALLLGKAIELAWTRAKLLRVLRHLLHRLDDVVAGHVADTPVQTERKQYLHALNAGDDVLHPDRIASRAEPAASVRPRMTVRESGDIQRIALHMATHWDLPHIDIQVDVLPKQVVERAQDRLVRLSAGYSYVLAGLVAGVAFLAAFTWILRPSNEAVLWTMRQDRSDLLIVGAATLCGGMLGWAVEVLRVRLRLLKVLLALRSQMQAA